ncbi:hypothetical protein N866_00980 [Actinotalea ferrariae CF5-4]|uniref:Helicase XPB/Ssl2 N-terminal domain-containing protein n=1 Tax=Actinotalea ferrariae CF5-4 TaxID=948458 RepID=A0A021VQI0_9CELL|nr:helicase C-terminal domain-containing protein [Actinotalea ferrariae]EYR63391.1 hypothetical protein N866_00980 [Actinotalea ferrariae CF5-4]
MLTDLAQWLTTLDADALHRVTVLRHDVLLGAPVRDLPDLAERLAHPASVASVVRELPVPAVQALEVLQALGAGASSDRAAAVLQPGGRDPQEHGEAVDGVVGHLVDCALAWPDGTGRLRLNPGVLAVLGTPLGLGRPGALLVAEVPAAELQKITRRWGLDVPKRKAELVDAVLGVLGDPSAVRRLVGEAPPQVTDVLLQQAGDAAARWPHRWGGVVVAVPDAVPDDDVPDDDVPWYLRDQAAFGRHRVASAWAVENGLAYGPRYEPLYAQVPSEVLLALVAPTLRAPFDPVPPPLPTTPVAPAQIAAAASGAVTELLGTVMATLEHLARTPATALKAGGVGAREIARVAKVVGAPPSDVRFALELAVHLNLLDAVAPGRLGVSDAFGAWRASAPARRAAELVQSWAGMHYAPTQDRGADGSSQPALARYDTGDTAVAARAAVLGLLRDLPDEVGVTTADAVEATVAWQLPVVLGAADGDLVRRTLTEAERLGLVALGRLTAIGDRLFTGGTVDALADALAGMVPDVQTRAVVGSDLTVVVMGTPAAEVVDLLDAVAEREARGQASTWRLTPASVRGALDAGYAQDDVLAALRRVGGGALPQSLEYLVRDVGRRHGHVQVRPSAAVVVGEDPALVAEIAAHRSLRRLGLHAVAPTVLVASAPVDAVLAGLRDAGYLPVEAAADGAPVVAVRRLALAQEGEAADGGVSDDGGTDGDVATQGEADADGGSDPDVDPDAVLARWAAEMAVDDGDEPGPGPASRRESAADVVARLLRGEAPPHQDASARLAAELARQARRLSGTEIDQLAHAIVHRLPVRIRYRSRSGGVSVRVVSQLEVRYGYLVGWCHLREETRMFALESVLGVIAEPG